jgi:hypothetical protein
MEIPFQKFRKVLPVLKVTAHIIRIEEYLEILRRKAKGRHQITGPKDTFQGTSDQWPEKKR